MAVVDPHLPRPTFDAVLLAAGRSERMGRDKAVLAGGWGGVLWERQWSLLASIGAAHRWLSVRPDQTWVPPGVATLRDDQPGEGPLAGVLAGWQVSTCTHLVVLAVDLPRLPAEWLVDLAGRCKEQIGSVGRHPDGRYEPLAALYPRAWESRWRDAFTRGERSLQRLLDDEAKQGRLAVRGIRDDESRWFGNLNTPDDLARMR
jgi:molybdenum cofactor guanylyltransferase